VPPAQQSSSRQIRLRLPVADHPAWITWGLLAANALVFAAMAITAVVTGQQALPSLLSSPDPSLLLRFGAKYGPAILGGEYWRLITAVFLHDGLLHLAINSYALFVIGVQTERFFGHVRYLIIYLLAGAASVAASYVAESTLAVGASGAIFGLVGALAVLFLRNRRIFGAMGRRQLSNLVLVIVINLIFGLSVKGIDNWAHLGGLVAGFLLAWFLAPRYQVVLPAPEYAVSGEGIIYGRAEDRNPLSQRWWVIPAALLLGVGLTWAGNAREGNSATGHQLRGETYLYQGETERAIDEFSAALALDDQLWGAYLYRGEALLNQNDLVAAMTDFETVISSPAPDRYRALAYTGTGRVKLLRGQVDGALSDLDQAVDLAPAEPFAHFVRGVIHYEIGQFAQARTDLQAALDLGLSDQQSVTVAGSLLSALKAGGG
jgi:membrane associated rhomboid family serine protease/predicted negative regulator of RcsB-dependent stress response